MRVTFNEVISDDFASMRVYNDRGLRVDRSIAVVDRRALSVRLAAPIAAGTYVVHWRVTGRDGHPVTDSFVFHYLKATRAGVVRPVRDPSAPFRAIFRGAALASLAVMFGSALFGNRRVARPAGIAAVLLLVGLLASDAMGLSGLSLGQTVAPSVMVSVLRSRTGIVRLVQIAALLAPVFWTRAAIVSGVSLAADAFAGHAAIAPIPAVSIPIQALHVLAMGAWLGGLATLIWDRTILRRYRDVALGSVVVLIVTGIFNAWAEVGTPARLVTTAYGRILLAKVLLLLGVLVVAAVNRTKGVTSRRLWTEIAGLLVIVGLASALSALAPARTGTGPVSKVFAIGSWRASFTADPGLVGANEVHLFLLTANGRLATDVASARVTARRRGRSGPADLRVAEAGKGHYVASTGAFDRNGRWTAFIEVTGSGGTRYRKVLTFTISP